MKTYFKVIMRGFRGNVAKLVSLIVIMALGIAFVAGLGTLSPTILDSLGTELDARNAPDLMIKSTSPLGFTGEQLARIESLDFADEAESLTVADMDDGGVNTRIYVYSSFDTALNRLDIDGRLPEGPGEVLVERQNNYTQKYSVGDTVTVMGAEYTVCGIVSNPLIFDRLGEPDMADMQPLEKIVYFTAEWLPFSMPVTDVYVGIGALRMFGRFSAAYGERAAEYAAAAEAALGDGVAVLTLEDNKSAVTAESYCEKVSVITAVFPVFFILVSALVVMTTMTRMIEEERSLIGCLKSLGMGNGAIVGKYLFMSAVCCLMAAAVGLSAGLAVLPAVIIPAFDTVLFLPASTGAVYPFTGVMSFIATSVAVLAVTAAVCCNRLREKPAALLVQRAPKPGKRVFLERAGFIWNRLSFKYKASLRNIFRYKKHLFMTVISVAGATAIAFAGFGLFNVADAESGGSFAGFQDSLRPISVVIIIFALLLCVFVIYNLTNLNIGERHREIATLGVLGYRKGEILGYVYREIMMMAAAGALFGIGLGCLLLWAVFGYLEFGSLADVKWYSYIVSFLLILCFTCITDLLLSRKILSIDMTSSLKSVD